MEILPHKNFFDPNPVGLNPGPLALKSNTLQIALHWQKDFIQCSVFGLRSF